MKHDNIRSVAMEVSAVYGVSKRKFADEVAENIIENSTQKNFLSALFEIKFMILIFISLYLLYELQVAENDPGIASYLIMIIFTVYAICRYIHLFSINMRVSEFHNELVNNAGNEGRYLNQYLSDAHGIDLLKHCLRLTNLQNRLIHYASIMLLITSVYCLWNLGFMYPLALYIGLCIGLVIVKQLSIRKAKWFLHCLQQKHREFNVFHGIISFVIY